MMSSYSHCFSCGSWVVDCEFVIWVTGGCAQWCWVAGGCALWSWIVGCAGLRIRDMGYGWSWIVGCALWCWVAGGCFGFWVGVIWCWVAVSLWCWFLVQQWRDRDER